MATGERACEGKSQASVIAAILEREPPAISSLQPMTPPALHRVVKKCLAKEPDDRWRAAKRPTVFQIEEIALVGCAGPCDVENRSERSGRNPLVPGSKHSVQCPVAPGDIGKQLVKFVVVRVHRKAAVGRGVVELWEEQLALPVGIIKGAGKKHPQTIRKRMAEAEAALVRAFTARLGCHTHVWQIPPCFVMMLTTPRKALATYKEELGPRMTSTRSIRSTSIGNSVPIRAPS